MFSTNYWPQKSIQQIKPKKYEFIKKICIDCTYFILRNIKTLILYSVRNNVR